MTIFRFDNLREIEITLGGEMPEQFRFVVLPNSAEEQKQVYHNWLGTEPK